MEFDPRENLHSGKSVIEAPAAPLAGTRKERIQRLQFGLVGLGTMVLMLGLANIITSTAQGNQAAVPDDMLPVANEDVPPPPARDPLAEAGVVPDLLTEPEVAVEAATGNDPDADGRLSQPLTENGDVPPPAEAK